MFTLYNQIMMAKLIIKVEIECFITDYLLEKAYFMCIIKRFK